MEKHKDRRQQNQALANRIWQMYQMGLQHHRRHNLYDRSRRCHRFYEGDQWYAEGGGLEEENLPVYNFIEPVVNYKVATVAMQNMEIHYSDMGGRMGAAFCDALDDYAARCWERQKMSARLWEVVREACITGESYLYFYDADLNHQMVDSTAVFLADEQEPDLQKQRYILMMERLPVETVRREALRYGMSSEDAQEIRPDSDTPWWSTEQNQKSSGEGKCTSLLYLEKTEEGIQFCRATRNTVYQPMQTVPGLKLYPMVSFVWKRRYHSARGRGEVAPLIANQIEANKTLFRRLQAMKASAFPKPVYVEGMVENPEEVTAVGSPIRVREGSVQTVNEVFTYLSPTHISSDATLLQQELINQSRELASAGDAALGNINPENASGAAISAVREAQAVPLNEQIAVCRQMVEDIALVWLDMLTAYYPTGLTETEQKRLPDRKMLKAMRMSVWVDVSPVDPYSRLAREQAVRSALQAGHITFEEYVKALDDRSSAPRQKFEEILNRRKKNEKGLFETMQEGGRA
ncbi:MAG: hypothetical protein IKU72_02005 [Oscillospiraceae bacterium]|nr:hypothetical protein [Oscillospiraceae bacterium]